VEDAAKKLVNCIKKLVDRDEPWQEKKQAVVDVVQSEGLETELDEFLDWFSEGY
jgi:hypothetical protein